ncbi:general secretion pathway protein GspK [Hyphomicrobium facile]|uniref:Type II secretion system protein K (GspK) n=1 Tax=Hyphomicrobium facile TaxID=51670 RepID=A0A1I7NFY3_9HYPH|nr:type II secretion system protein GspK [Hyphomicrobium facile]SFV33466.1 type II secretion system protein K (GspK) [Hyphomicrobium facile]
MERHSRHLPEAANNGERGFALLVVLWVIATGTLLVAAFNTTVRSGASFMSSETQFSRAEHLLDAGLEIAAARLIDESSARWRPDGKPRAISFDGMTLQINVSDPNGLIDLNKSDEKLLGEFFRAFASDAGAAATIVKGILDARIKASGQSGAPDSRSGGGSPAFVDIGQLRKVPGVSMALFRRVLPYVTVHSRDGSANLETAPAELRAAFARARGTRDFPGQQHAISKSNGAADEDDEDQFGPAYIVSVKVSAPNSKRTAAKIYVIAVGLDDAAPYRLLSQRPSA